MQPASEVMWFAIKKSTERNKMRQSAGTTNLLNTGIIRNVLVNKCFNAVMRKTCKGESQDVSHYLKDQGRRAGKEEKKEGYSVNVPVP